MTYLGGAPGAEPPGSRQMGATHPEAQSKRLSLGSPSGLSYEPGHSWSGGGNPHHWNRKSESGDCHASVQALRLAMTLNFPSGRHIADPQCMVEQPVAPDLCVRPSSGQRYSEDLAEAPVIRSLFRELSRTQSTSPLCYNPAKRGFYACLRTSQKY